MRVALLLLLPLVLAACGGRAAVSYGASDCVGAWNAPGNADNRELVAGERWEVEVTTWQIDEPAAGLTGQGCSFFFFTQERFLSVSGAWQGDGGLRWGIPPTLRGDRAPEDRVPEPNAELRPDGTLRPAL